MFPEISELRIQLMVNTPCRDLVLSQMERKRAKKLQKTSPSAIFLFFSALWDCTQGVRELELKLCPNCVQSESSHVLRQRKLNHILRWTQTVSKLCPIWVKPCFASAQTMVSNAWPCLYRLYFICRSNLSVYVSNKVAMNTNCVQYESVGEFFNTITI